MARLGRPPKALPRPNPLRNIREIREPTPMALKAAAESRANDPRRLLNHGRRTCPNKYCVAPQIEDDGVCHACGMVVDDSNIVSEVTFGESSSGAAIVQGSYVGADQAGARSSGPGFGRGNETSREATFRQGQHIITAMGNTLQIEESTVKRGGRVFKLAIQNNFTQGRRIDMVAAVCLYTACRQEETCKIMLIDFADRLQVNVFKLGHFFTVLHKTVTFDAGKEKYRPIVPEDLIGRFAEKLELGNKTKSVVDTATRLVQRMRLDWIAVGRKPSGVCGAALIMAARMHNLRRTPTEVVYVVKVTSGTIQKRLEEFKRTAVSDITVDAFQSVDVRSGPHEAIPPSLYEKTEEFLASKRAKKRKRSFQAVGTNEEQENEPGNKHQRTRDSGTPSLTPEIRRDADGFVIPPTPSSIRQESTPTDDTSNIDPALLPSLDLTEDPADVLATFENYVDQIGELYPENVEPLTERILPTKEDKRRYLKQMKAPDWKKIEEDLAATVSEVASDPTSQVEDIRYAQAKANAELYVMRLDAASGDPDVSMDAHVGDDEFADDLEVQNCLLPAAEIAKKEKFWVNENKEWLRKMQLREWKRKMEDKGPKKATRNRVRKPRFGEGQKSPADSPAQAAKAVLQMRQLSKKINYEALNFLFDDSASGSRGKKGGLGSAATSRVTSRAGSVAGTSVDDASDIESTTSLDTPIPLVRGTYTKRNKDRNPVQTQTAQMQHAEAAPADATEAGGDGQEEEEEEEEDDSQHYINAEDADRDPMGDLEEGDDDDDDEDEPNDLEDWKKGLGAAFAGTEVEEYVGEEEEDAFAGLESFDIDD